MNQQPLLSICIPTFKREYLIDQILQTIYSQGCSLDLFEVCITDNSETDETKELIETKYKDYENLHYKKVYCKGFMNSVEALKYGHGRFIKLHNDYSMFKIGSLQKLIDQVRRNQKEKPLIFYTLRGKKPAKYYSDFDSFVKTINYLSTWSTSFAIWKEDLDRILATDIEPNYMYPHTTILFQEHFKKSFIVDDYVYFENVEPKKKGGYNLVDNFVRIYLTMVKKDLLVKGHISQKTYDMIEARIIRFVASCYVKLKDKPNYTFRFDGMKTLIVDQCGISKYCLLWFYIAGYKAYKTIAAGRQPKTEQTASPVKTAPRNARKKD